jgi:hypothetical protein
MPHCHTCQDTGYTHPTQEELLEWQILGEVTGRAPDCPCRQARNEEQDVYEEAAGRG